MAVKGLKVLETEAGGPGREIGLAPGDEILSVNGHPVPDELALKFHLGLELVRLEVRKGSGLVEEHELDLSDGRGLGVRVEDFRTRTCNNDCLFCFIEQLPPDVRPSLKVRDDDYRLSFLHGNYVTLTNLPERELDRIVEQKLSPLYVSVHATDAELRTRILGRRKPDDLQGKMAKLIAGGVRLHTQVVLMPGINDGAHLEKTVSGLFALFPGVDSVAVVPLGLSDHGRAREAFDPVTPAYCRGVIGQAAPWQERFRREIGRTFAYLADEFYIQGGVPLPEAPYYDDFAQIEDGVGMVRRFLVDFGRELGRRRRSRPHLRGTLATGRLFAPFLRSCVERLNRRLHSRVEVAEIPSRFLGSRITVAGLLAGSDIVTALEGRELGDFVVIPQEAVSRSDGILVDNMAPGEIGRRLGRPVHTSGRTAADFVSLVCERL